MTRSIDLSSIGLQKNVCFPACDGGCTECHESWNGRGPVCSGCDGKDEMPQGSKCVTKCRTGFYQEHKACKGTITFFVYLKLTYFKCLKY